MADWFFDKTDEDFEVKWLVPLFYRISSDLKVAADNVDKFKKDDNRSTLNIALNELQSRFKGLVRERTPVTSTTSKKHAMFVITNVLFKAYFSLNNLNLCQKLINFVDGPSGVNSSNLTYFPVCDVVMYKFYVGRMKMFQDNYEEANECLR